MRAAYNPAKASWSLALACLTLCASLSASDPADDSGTAPPLLSFVVKNEYLSAPAERSEDESGGAVIEPYRATFFTATGAVSADDVQNTRKLGSHALRLKIKHVEMLIERGGSNAERMTEDLVKMERDLDLMTSKAEAELEGVSYSWVINGKEHKGRTVGPLVFELGTSEAELAVQVKLTETRGAPIVDDTHERMTTIEVPCRYVRRSMFSLTPGDRARFLEASQKMYQHTTEEGRKLFGEGYVGAQDLWAAHALLAADSKGGDPAHLALSGGSNSMAAIASTEMRAAAVAGHMLTRSYYKRMPGGKLRNGVPANRPGGEDQIFMEIDGDANDYHDPEVFARPLFGSDGGDNDETADSGGSLIVASRDDSAYSENALLQTAAKHNLLAKSHGIGVLTNYASFAVALERSVQAVDPSVAMPYIDADDQAFDDGATFETVTWEEKFEVPEALLAGSARANERLLGDGAAETRGTESQSEEADASAVEGADATVTVHTEGTFAYVPVFTGSEERNGESDVEGGKITVYKGFTLPMILQGDVTKEPKPEGKRVKQGRTDERSRGGGEL